MNKKINKAQEIKKKKKKKQWKRFGEMTVTLETGNKSKVEGVVQKLLLFF